MIIYPSLPSGHTTFCDDIRQEITGKATFVGAYGAHMFVASFPAMVPKICCAVTYREAPDVVGQVAIRIIHEFDETETILGELEIEVKAEDLHSINPDEPFFMREGRFFFEFSPFAISGPGVLKVRAFRDGNEVRLGALAIVQAPQPPEVEAD